MRKIALEVIGWLATVGIIGAYFALPVHWISLHTFYVLGVFTGCGMALSLYPKKAWPAFVLNVLWAMISFIGAIGT